MQINDGSGAATRGVGEFTIYPNLTSDKEFLNSNYLNQYITWIREEIHNQDFFSGGTGKGEVFSH